MPFLLIPEVWLELPTPCFHRGPCRPSFLSSTSKASAQHQFLPPVLCHSLAQVAEGSGSSCGTWLPLPLLSTPWISCQALPVQPTCQKGQKSYRWMPTAVPIFQNRTGDTRASGPQKCLSRALRACAELSPKALACWRVGSCHRHMLLPVPLPNRAARLSVLVKSTTGMLSTQSLRLGRGGSACLPCLIDV